MSLIKYKCDNCGFLNPRLIKTKCDTCHNKYYKFNNDFNTLCNDCSLNLNPRGNTTFTLKDNEFNSTEILLLDHISNNFYNIKSAEVT